MKHQPLPRWRIRCRPHSTVSSTGSEPRIEDRAPATTKGVNRHAHPGNRTIHTVCKDVLGRYVCNGLDEALASTDSSRSPNARMFDVIILGGGSFGSVCAQHLFTQDSTHSHRILVLDGGPFTIPEHVQNLPVLAGLNVPGATSIQDLRSQGQFGPDKPREEVWGIAWHSATKFPGLAYCLGGRSYILEAGVPNFSTLK